MNRNKQLIIVRGAGDIATGTIHRFCRCGYPVLALETANPSAIRRQVAFSEAMYDGEAQIEGITCKKASSLQQALALLGLIPGETAQHCPVALLEDADCSCLEGLKAYGLKPFALVDAILAKRNLGTHRGMAPITIALGPGFCAGKDVDFVIETMRGHNLGRIYTEGEAIPNTGVPGAIAGYTKERVIHAPGQGIVYSTHHIGDFVSAGEVIAELRDGEAITPVTTQISGIIRGLIRNGYPVTRGFKMADVDPRQTEYDNCFTISDKARCIAGSVLEALLYQEGRL